MDRGLAPQKNVAQRYGANGVALDGEWTELRVEPRSDAQTRRYRSE